MFVGYFPYLFNTAANINYTGPLPEADRYCPTGFKTKKARDAFFKWYHDKKQSGELFSMQEELKKYTDSDVDILLRCCMKFNDLFIEHTGLSPFQESITIAQACNKIFRKDHLKENTIGVRNTDLFYM